MTIPLGLKKESLMIILAFSFLQPQQPGEEPREVAKFNGYQRRGTFQAEYSPPLLPNLG